MGLYPIIIQLTQFGIFPHAVFHISTQICTFEHSLAQFSIIEHIYFQKLKLNLIRIHNFLNYTKHFSTLQSFLHKLQRFRATSQARCAGGPLVDPYFSLLYLSLHLLHARVSNII